MEFGLKWTSRVCHGRHGKVGIVEFGFYGAVLACYLQWFSTSSDAYDDADDACIDSVSAEVSAADGRSWVRKVWSPDGDNLPWLPQHQAASTSHVAQGWSRHQQLRSTGDWEHQVSRSIKFWLSVSSRKLPLVWYQWRRKRSNQCRCFMLF